MDYDYWLRISKQFRLFITHAYLAKFRLHSTSKTIESAIQEWDEETQMIQHYTRSQNAALLSSTSPPFNHQRGTKDSSLKHKQLRYYHERDWSLILEMVYQRGLDNSLDYTVVLF
jgi:hypothetical protein